VNQKRLQELACLQRMLIHGLHVSLCLARGTGRVGQNHTSTCVYGTICRKITRYTVVFGVHIRFWPTLIQGVIYRGASTWTSGYKVALLRSTFMNRPFRKQY